MLLFLPVCIFFTPIEAFILQHTHAKYQQVTILLFFSVFSIYLNPTFALYLIFSTSPILIYNNFQHAVANGFTWPSWPNHFDTMNLTKCPPAPFFLTGLWKKSGIWKKNNRVPLWFFGGQKKHRGLWFSFGTKKSCGSPYGFCFIWVKNHVPETLKSKGGGPFVFICQNKIWNQRGPFVFWIPDFFEIPDSGFFSPPLFFDRSIWERDKF